MTIQIPDELARGLEGIAAVQRKTVEQLALDSLRLLFDETSSPEALLRSVRRLPHPSVAAVDDLEAAILSGRLPVRDDGAFDGRPPDVIYQLDTNAISDLMRADVRIENWISALDRGDRVVTCTIVRGEILFGIARLPQGRRRAELEDAGLQFLNAFRCEPIPQTAGDYYANLKLTRQQSGLTLDENDLWVAATALALGATLVTRDGDFVGIPGLSVMAPE